MLHIFLVTAAIGEGTGSNIQFVMRKVTVISVVIVLFAAAAAGGIGGIVNFLIAPIFGALHITTALGVHIAPHLNKVVCAEVFLQAYGYFVELLMC